VVFHCMPPPWPSTMSGPNRLLPDTGNKDPSFMQTFQDPARQHTASSIAAVRQRRCNVDDRKTVATGPSAPGRSLTGFRRFWNAPQISPDLPALFVAS